MTKEIDFVADLNDKYAALEYELDEKLKAVAQAEQQLQSGSSKLHRKEHPEINHSLETAKQRNFTLLKSLEVAKARLRSRATFSPLETILQKAIGNYVKQSSLVPSSTVKAYGPTYV
ncbi:uncharacterized protein LOC126569757 isoform X1 [Anopheles aquasalis]|uniref:uncharacterized protein LOC126569757 isoform X1 n=1 Tax=Anopheles aquasalis TaxID=42839 RepID=UPI00215B283B|nr:uncharacterized protein LOC126569757 isoform X1 [Anopheles aquasalis]